MNAGRDNAVRRIDAADPYPFDFPSWDAAERPSQPRRVMEFLDENALLIMTGSAISACVLAYGTAWRLPGGWIYGALSVLFAIVFAWLTAALIVLGIIVVHGAADTIAAD